MKPQRFEIGQAVTPNKNHPLKFEEGCPPFKFGEVYHVMEYHQALYKFERAWYIVLEELPHDKIYLEMSFDPVITDAILEKELSTISEPQTA